MNPLELKKTIDTYVSQVLPHVGSRQHAWLALAWNVFKASRKDTEQLQQSLPADVADTRVSLDELLSPHEAEFLTSHASEVIDYCCDRYDSSPLSYNDRHGDADFIAREMVKMAEITSEDTVYLPFAGLGETALNLPNGVAVTSADELDPEIRALSLMRLLTHGVKFASDDAFAQRDSFLNMEHLYEDEKDRKYDVILMTPPVGYDADSLSLNPHCRAICDGFGILSDNGRMIVALPVDDLTHPFTRDFLARLVKTQCIKAVWQISSDKKKNVDDNICLVEIVMQDCHDIRFVNISPSRLEDPETDLSAYSRTVPYPELRNDNLLPASYVARASKKHGRRIKLSECLELVPKVPVHQEMPLVSWDNLSYNYLDCTIETDNLRTLGADADSRYMCVKGNLLLIGFGRDFRVGKLETTAQRPYAALFPNILAFRLTDPGVNPDYLLRELTSEEYLPQFYNIDLADIMLLQDPKDFLDFTLIIPSGEDQMSQLLDDARMSLGKTQAVLVDLNRKHITDIRLRKHTLISQLGGFVGKWHTMRKCINANACNALLNTKVTRTFPDTLQEWIEDMEANLLLINEKVKQLTNLQEDYGEVIKADPDTLIREYCASLKPENSRVTIGATEARNAGISIPKKALFRVFENIVNNAWEHGFTDAARNDYELRFQVTEEGASIVITIANNGTPLDADISEEEVFELGKSSRMYEDTHGGQGGYDIRNILEVFGAQVECISTPDAKFTFAYRLKFPKNGDIQQSHNPGALG